MKTMTSPSLTEKWNQLKTEHPALRIRDAATKLGVSEAQLLATRCGDTVTRLSVDFKQFFKEEITRLGVVKAITRNDDVVHEKVGEYLNPGFNDDSPVGLFVGDDIDLRIFLFHWKITFAVTEEAHGKPRHSIQFFDKWGQAVHKIYLTGKSKTDVFHEILEKYKHEDQSPEQEVDTVSVPPSEKRNDNPDKEGFQADWVALKDTHHFFPMLKKYELSRVQALELAPEGNAAENAGPYAQKVSNDIVRKTITRAAEDKTPIMVFVGNRGIIQIHTGPVKKIMDHRDWFNVMDPDFNLHLRETAVDQCWVVRKPTSDGLVTSVEIFDKDENLICTLFGKRKPGIPEDPAWASLVRNVELESVN